MNGGPCLLVAAGPPEAPTRLAVRHVPGAFELETPTSTRRVEPPEIVDQLLGPVTAGDPSGTALLLVLAQEGTRLARSCAFYRDHGRWIGLDDAQPRDDDDVRAALLWCLTTLIERTITLETMGSAA